jgi:hypothetical protein
MKRFIQYAAVLALAAGTAFASGVADGQGGIFAAGGPQVNETRSVGSFESIAIDGSGEVVYQRGAGYSVAVEAPQSIIKRVETKVENRVLILRIKPGAPVWGSFKLRFTVTAPELSGVTVNGSGSFAAVDRIEADAFAVRINGSGRAIAALDAGTVEIVISGSGDVELGGSADRLDAKVVGSGNVAADALAVGDAVVLISGSGNVRVNATDRLDATISGSGNVLYRGQPRVSLEGGGSGRLKALD